MRMLAQFQKNVSSAIQVVPLLFRIAFSFFGQVYEIRDNLNADVQGTLLPFRATGSRRHLDGLMKYRGLTSWAFGLNNLLSASDFNLAYAPNYAIPQNDFGAANRLKDMEETEILCVGKDPGLLRSRCAVLEHAGHHAQAVMVHDADALLASNRFDLIILSVILTDEEKQHIADIVGDRTPILILKKLTFASELLAEVDRQLMYARHNAPA